MIGTLEDFRLTHGSFGQQHSTIDGVKYLTWFDLADPKLKGLRAGAKVEYEARPGPTVLCNMPEVTSELASAKIVRVVRQAGEAT